MKQHKIAGAFSANRISMNGVANPQTDSPREPNLTEKLEEAYNYLLELHLIQRSIRDKAFGEESEEGELGPKPVSIKDLALELSVKSACLVGEAKTILSRL